MEKQKIAFCLFFLFATFHGKSQDLQTKDTTIFSLKAKLLSMITNSPGCGNYAWAIALKYEVIESKNFLQEGSIILVIQPCPKLLGKNFLKNSNIYSLGLSKDNLDPFGYFIVNTYKDKKWPIIWCREINLAE